MVGLFGSLNTAGGKCQFGESGVGHFAVKHFTDDRRKEVGATLADVIVGALFQQSAVGFLPHKHSVAVVGVSTQVNARTLLADAHFVLWSIYISIYPFKLWQGTELQVVVFAVHGVERINLGHDQRFDVVVGNVERGHFCAVAQVEFRQQVVAQVECLHHVGILERQFGEQVVAQVKVVYGVVVVERHFCQLVVGEVDVLEQCLVEGIVGTSYIQGVELVARQCQCSQTAVPCHVDRSQTGIGDRQLVQFVQCSEVDAGQRHVSDTQCRNLFVFRHIYSHQPCYPLLVHVGSGGIVGCCCGVFHGIAVSIIHEEGLGLSFGSTVDTNAHVQVGSAGGHQSESQVWLAIILFALHHELVGAQWNLL